MKKQILAVLAAVVLSAGAAYAAPGDGSPGAGVLKSVHDMNSKFGTDLDGGQGRVCAFCHTPHHANLDAETGNGGPLWSRPTNGANYAAYGSTTFHVSDFAVGVDSAVGPTRLCLSCHDGSLSVDTHYAMLGGQKIGSGALDAFGSGNITGAGLTKDHPLGFAYNDVACTDSASVVSSDTVGTDNGTCKPYIRQSVNGGLLGDGSKSLAFKGNSNIYVADRLFANTDGKMYMTCATCHDVHNRKNMDLPAPGANYLVLAPQAGSALCLTCHIK
jgi:hypothetical protein